MASGFRIIKSSLIKVLRNLDRARKEREKEAASALYIEAQEILTDSRENYVPVDMGILRSDSGVTSPRMERDGPQITIWYGNGPAKDYAVPQHERLDFHHTVGGPKYLERPLLERSGKIAGNVGKKIAI